MRNFAYFFIAIMIIFFLSIPARPTLGAAVGPASLVKDINPNVDLTPSTLIGDLTSVDGTLYFVADDDLHGPELWKIGPDNVPAMLKDIFPGTVGGLNVDFEWDDTCRCIKGALDGALYFEANDGVHGPELWRTDGSPDGTVLVKDIDPGYTNTAIYGLTELNGQLYFSAKSATGGRELWRTDGSEAGTVLVKDINPGPASANPGGLSLLNGSLYFWADDGVHGVELWRTDGSAAGTSLVTDITPDGQSITTDLELHRVGSRLLFTRSDAAHGTELWQSDGSAAGTGMVKDIAAGPPSGVQLSLYFARTMGGAIYFTANDGIHGNELWRSDGTEAGTAMVKDVQPGADSTGIYDLTATDGLVFFHTRVNGVDPDPWRTQLWRSDGTAAGTTMIADTFGGTGAVVLEHLTAIGDMLYFTFEVGVDGNLRVTKLWQSDGSAAGTVAFEPTTALGIDSGANIARHAGRLYFTGRTAAYGNELWSSDGTAAGTSVIDIGQKTLASSIYAIVTVGDIAYFSADDGVHGRELWRSDGTAAGTGMVLDLRPGALGGVNASIHVFSDTLYFGANDGVNGNWLWRSDGTAAGTKMIKAMLPFVSGGLEGPALIPIHDAFYFLATGAGDAQELWRSDGSAAGTVLVKTISAASQYPPPNSLTGAGDGVFFTASDEEHGDELWYSDGTAAGTRMVKDITPGSGSSNAYRLTGLGSTVIFQIYVGGGSPRYQLWRSDGSAAGTFMIKDRISITTNTMVAMNGAVYFGAYDETNIDHLWRTDGTVAGTIPVTNQFLPARNSLAIIDDVLYFTVGNHYELWRTNGTAAGTWRVSTVKALNLFNISNRLYLSGWDEHGYELWRSDGTAAGTTLVQDITPGFDSSLPNLLTRVGDRLLFTADDHVHGNELWSVPLAPDTTPPTVSVPQPITASTGDPAGLQIGYTAAAIDDYDAAPSLSCAPASGSIFPIGATTATCTASDISGNSASASFTVTVALRHQVYLPLVSH
jgi:ELWxxDGT repeat protein